MPLDYLSKIEELCKAKIEGQYKTDPSSLPEGRTYKKMHTNPILKDILYWVMQERKKQLSEAYYHATIDCPHTPKKKPVGRKHECHNV